MCEPCKKPWHAQVHHHVMEHKALWAFGAGLVVAWVMKK